MHFASHILIFDSDPHVRPLQARATDRPRTVLLIIIRSEPETIYEPKILDACDNLIVSQRTATVNSGALGPLESN